jgi:Helix-turn-helix domain
VSGAAARVGVGTRFLYDGETLTVEEIVPSTGGIEVLLKDVRGRRLRLSLRELLVSERARLIPEVPGPASDDLAELAATVLGGLTKTKREDVLRRAAHVREVLTGYRSGSELLAAPDEPNPQYLPSLPLMRRYQAKAAELGIGVRTLRRWVGAYQARGEAGLVEAEGRRDPLDSADERWVQTAVEVMVEHTGESKPSRTMVIERTRARVIAREQLSIPVDQDL